MAHYTEKMDADAQITTEEWIAAIIQENFGRKYFGPWANAADEEAAELGRRILLEVLRQFRPDLVED